MRIVILFSLSIIVVGFISCTRQVDKNEISEIISTLNKTESLESFDLINKLAFPEIYKLLTHTKIGRNIESNSWTDCILKFINQKYDNIYIKLDSEIKNTDLACISGRIFTTKYKLGAETSIQEGLFEGMRHIFISSTENLEGIAYIIKRDGSVLITSKTKAVSYWNQWFNRKFK